MTATRPSFLIIGAGRSGTTSLYQYLRQHPAVFMSAVKEPNFFAFADGRVPNRGTGVELLRRISVTTLAEYEELFAESGDASAIGEASTRYMWTPEAPARIARLLPGVLLVAILRNPVDRAYASYLGLRREGLEPAVTFEQAVHDDIRGLRAGWAFPGPVQMGFYHRHLFGYHQHFAKERIRVYLYEDLVADPAGLLRDLFSFLGVDPDFSPDTSRRHARTGLIRNRWLRFAWMRSLKLRHGLRTVVPEPIRDRIRDRATRDLVRPPLERATRARLHELFRPDLLALQDLLDRDLSHWLVDDLS